MRENYLMRAILPVLLLLLANGVMAQVTIGSSKTPASYEKLKIDGSGKGGLRLARLTQLERDALETTMIESQAGGITVWKASAKGLVIYNVTSEVIEYWNGSQWNQLQGNQPFANGLKSENGIGKLGGTLTKSTTIDQAGKDFSLNIKTDGELSVDGGTLLATNTHLAVGSQAKPAALSVKSPTDVELLAVSKTNQVTIGADKAASFDVNAGTLTVDDTRVTIPQAKTLQYKDGNETLDPGISNLVLFSDANGNANWKKLHASTSTMTIKVLPRTPEGVHFPVGEWTTLTETIKLGRGKWMIMGRYTTYTSLATNGSNDNANYLGSLRLFGLPTNVAPNQGIITVASTVPETKSSTGTTGMASFASPTMTTYIEIGTDVVQEFTIDFITNKKQTYLPMMSQGWLGVPYFMALKISDN